MKKLNKIAIALSLALCVMPLSVTLVLAETAEEIATGLNAEVVADNQVIEEAEANNETANITENDTGGIPDSSEPSDEELPPVLDESGEVVSPGILPDSPLYWLTILIEKLHVILTFDTVEKTELLEEQALERIAEAQELIEKGNTEQAEGAINAYMEKVVEAQTFLAQLTETDSEIMQKLETALSNKHANNIQTLGGLLDKLPPQAAQKVALNIVRSMEKSIAKMDKKDQQTVAKELKKVTKGLENSELTEEDEDVLENLEQTLGLQNDELEEVIASTSGTTVRSMALTTNSSKSPVQTVGSNATKPKSETNTNLVQTKQQEPKQQPEGDFKNELKDETKVQEQQQLQVIQQEGKVKAARESALKEENSSLNNSVQKLDGAKTQQKTQTDRENGDTSGGKAKN